MHLLHRANGDAEPVVERRKRPTYGDALAALSRARITIFTLDVTVPPNTTAQVTLWRTRLDAVREGGRALPGTAGVLAARQEGSDVLLEVGSGSYTFTAGRAP